MENSIEYVKEKWQQLTAFSKKEEIKEQLWSEIVYRYSARHRHYHNINHLAHLFTWCDKFLDKIKNRGVMGFAIIYHNVVYDTYRNDNEEQSAAFAEAQLKTLNVSAALIDNVKIFIRATKNYQLPEDFSLKNDLEMFLDFDMAILGVDEQAYKMYSEKIRQEYSKYPDPVYKEGRKLALQKVLISENIFSTGDVKEVLEQKARENISREVSLL